MEKVQLKRAIGKADACELLSVAFAFPNDTLVEGLTSGTLQADAEACLEDMGVGTSQAKMAVDGLRAWEGAGATEVLALMRRTYSRIYLAPGGAAPVFPYESPFLHRAEGRPGLPALFRTPVTLDVERRMHDAGVAAKDERTAPCDSVFEEFEFLSYLFAKQADALRCGDDHEAERWQAHSDSFLADHAFKWLPSFMGLTAELAPDAPYAGFAAYARAVLAAL